MKYNLDAALFHCPSDLSPDHPEYKGAINQPGIPWTAGGGCGYLCTWTSYGMNTYFNTAWPPYRGGTWWAEPLKVGVVKGVTVIVADAHPGPNPWSAIVNGPDLGVNIDYPYNSYSTSVGARHNSGANVLFTDGHAEWLSGKYEPGTLPEVLDPKSAKWDPLL